MANTIKIRRSATQGATPTTAQLSLGELAINTYDGKLFLKKDDGTQSIVEVGGAGGASDIASLSDVTVASVSDGQFLQYNATNSAWENTTFVSGGTAATIIAPFAHAYIDTTSAGTGTGISWSAYNSSTGEVVITFASTQANTDYSVVTDNEWADDVHAQVGSKTTTGFSVFLYSASQNESPASKPVSIFVFAPDPTVTIGGTGAANLNDLADVSAGSPTNGQILQYNTTTSAWEPGAVPVSGITVKQAQGDGGTVDVTATSVTEIVFDANSGFSVTDNTGSVFVSLGSTFKDWYVAGQTTLTAEGEDSIELIAGTGITLTTTTSHTGSATKALTIAASGGGSTTLAGLTDVSLSNLNNGDILQYNSSTSLWTNEVISSGGGIGEEYEIDTTGGASSIRIGTNAAPNDLPGGVGGNISIGYDAGLILSNGNNNIVLGSSALKSVDQSFNTVIGNYAHSLGTLAGSNVVIGYEAGYKLSGQNATIIGTQAGKNNTSGNNVMIGHQAGWGSGSTTIAGNRNVYVGTLAAFGATNTQNAVVIGYAAGQSLSNTNALESIIIGDSAAQAPIASKLVAIGFEAQKNGGVDFGVAIGHRAGQYATGDRSIYIGASAGQGSTSFFSSGSDNIVLGDQAGLSFRSADRNIVIGANAGKNITTASSNVIIGYQAAQEGANGFSVIIGQQAGKFGSGFLNVYIGAKAGYGQGTGTQNVAIGNEAGYTLGTANDYNVLLGAFAGTKLEASNNVIVGGNSDTTRVSGDNNIVLGYNAELANATSNNVVIGDANIVKFSVPGINFVLKDNGAAPSEGQVLTADASGEGYWATPSGGGGSTDLSYDAPTRVLSSSTGTGATLPEVVAAGDSGLMTGADKTKLDGIAVGAEVNAVTSVNGQTGAVTVATGSTDLAYTAATRVLSSSSGADATLPEVVAAGDSGLMTGADKTKLDGVATGADVTPAYATQAQAQAGTNNTALMTPLRTAQAISALGGGGGGGGGGGVSDSTAIAYAIALS